ncbi:MAG: DUF4364 family protein [Blautia sp.]|jgi:DNA-binding PadR family transcriptional regulator
MAQPLTLYKLIVLYMLDKVTFPLSNSQISEFILDREYTSYFHLQQALFELADAKLVEIETVRNTSYYHLTEEGSTTLSYFSTEIPSAIKEEIEFFLTEKGCELQKKFTTLADYYKASSQEYTVRCQVKEKATSLIDMTISVPSQEAAETICNNWEQKYEEIYSHIMETLL